VLEIAEHLVKLSEKYKIPYIFKASYRKANRSKIDSFAGIGDLNALKILAEVKKRFAVPVITDIHSTEEAAIAAQYVDILQIPAFLCRQTDLLVAAAKTGKWINIKKGQFLSGASMKFAVGKVRDSGNNNIMVTDRGNMFGYQDIVVDFRNIPIMQKIGVPVIMDITHSLQQPNQEAGVSGGVPEMIETIGKAAISVGADGIFIETHPDPEAAKSDGANMLKLNDMDKLLNKLVAIRKTINSF
jgi:2-dehydro-3-deoxyphosphooctonate aldolase (KDO 8-P synthase)